MVLLIVIVVIVVVLLFQKRWGKKKETYQNQCNLIFYILLNREMIKTTGLYTMMPENWKHYCIRLEYTQLWEII